MKCLEINSGDIVALYLDRSDYIPLCQCGILKSRATFMNIDTQFPAERVNMMLEDAQPTYIISNADHRESLSEEYRCKTICENEIGWDLDPSFDLMECLTETPQQTAYISYTSGSEGKPKGVQVSRSNLHNLLSWAKREFNTSKFDIVFAISSISFDISIFETLFPFVCRKPGLMIANYAELGLHLKRHRNILLNTVPSVVKELMKSPESLENVTVLNMAGEEIPEKTIGLLRTYSKLEIRNLYGPTETTIYSICYKFPLETDEVFIGSPVDHTELLLLDDNNMPLPEPGSTGQLAIAGKGVSKGYLNKPELTDAAFKPHPQDSNKIIYKTGDWVRFNEKGKCKYIGRKDQQIKVNGCRIELDEIRNVLLQRAGIDDAVVMINHNGKLIAFIESLEEWTANELTNQLASRIPSYMIPPIQFIFLPEIPKTENGKIDKTFFKTLISNA